MILRIQGWEFEVDIASTMEYSAREAAEHCTCGYCRNFYAAVDEAYPKLRPFLAQFGLDVEAPDEMSPIPYEDGLVGCDGEYVVFGRILKTGAYEMEAGAAHLLAETPPGGTYPVDRVPQGKECFVLYTMDIMLPWALDEPMEGGDTPLPSDSVFGKLKRFWSKKFFS